MLLSPCEKRMLLQVIQLSIRCFLIKPTTCYTSFCSCFSPKPCTDLIAFIMSYNLMKEIIVLSLFRFSDLDLCSSGLNNICTILILNFSCTFILMSWIHVACFSGQLKIGIAWCTIFISSCRLESSSSFWINLLQCVHKLYQCHVFWWLSGLFNHILGLILPYWTDACNVKTPAMINLLQCPFHIDFIVLLWQEDKWNLRKRCNIQHYGWSHWCHKSHSRIH